LREQARLTKDINRMSSFSSGKKINKDLSRW